MSMITATTWVPRGFPAPLPTKYAVDDDELQRISKLAKLKLDDAKEDLEDAKVDKMDKDDDADDDDDDNSDSDDELSGPGNGVKIPQSAGYAMCETCPL
jgi:periodic tryptophan protein 1